MSLICAITLRSTHSHRTIRDIEVFDVELKFLERSNLGAGIGGFLQDADAAFESGRSILEVVEGRTEPFVVLNERERERESQPVMR